MIYQVAIHGIGGRMGEAVRQCLAGDDRFELIGGVRRQPRAPGEVSSLDELANTPDAIIDFSLPEALGTVVEWCRTHRVALVSGTTGLSERHLAALQTLAETVPVLHAANMSRGVALLRRLVVQAAQSLGQQADIEVLEHHHRAKQDAPSGTALMLGEAAARAAGQHNDPAPDRSGPRKRGTVGHAVLRGGDVIGEHTVFFHLDGERIELTHRAGDRRLFAQGAVAACAWLCDGRTPGFYSIDDTL